MNIYYTFDNYNKLPNEIQNHIISFLPKHPLMSSEFKNLMEIILMLPPFITELKCYNNCFDTKLILPPSLNEEYYNNNIKINSILMSL
jgi:hypothetical protein